MSNAELAVIVQEHAHIRQITHVETAPDPATAAARAWELARSFRPRRPMVRKSRRLFRESDGSWVVSVEGVTDAFVFTVSVVEHHGVYRDEDPA